VNRVAPGKISTIIEANKALPRVSQAATLIGPGKSSDV
jgi:hypothetical protein